MRGHSKDNKECTCSHTFGYRANLDCPVRGHTDPVRSVCFSPCGEKIASGGGDYLGNEDYSIRIWDAKTGEQIGSPLRGHSADVYSVCFSSDGKQLTSGSDDTTVRNWDLATRASLS